MRRLLIVAVLFFAGSAAAQSPPVLPSNQEVEGALARNFGWKTGYVGKVYGVALSRIPGMVQAFAELKKGQLTVVYITTNGQYALIGEVLPFGADPFAPTRAALTAADGPSRGGSAGGVTLVEFADLECEDCKAVAPTLDRIAKDFPQVRQVFQNFPLSAKRHPWARLAADWADCIGRADPKAFWRFTAAVYAVQADIAPDAAHARLKEIAASAGADPEAAARCAVEPSTEDRVAASVALGQSLSVRGTPTVFVNGRQLPAELGTMSYDEVKAVIAFELDHAGR